MKKIINLYHVAYSIVVFFRSKCNNLLNRPLGFCVMAAAETGTSLCSRHPGTIDSSLAAGTSRAPSTSH